MKIDDSFKKPGSVPFKWEIRPGVPKLQNPKPPPLDLDHRLTEFGSHKHHHIPETPRKLKPPPAGLCYQPPLEPRTRTRSSRSLSPGLGLPGLARPDVVPSGGCFLGKLKTNMKKTELKPETVYCSDLETSSTWSISSSRRSVSPLPSSFASRRSLPRPVGNADWAHFGLF